MSHDGLRSRLIWTAYVAFVVAAVVVVAHDGEKRLFSGDLLLRVDRIATEASHKYGSAQTFIGGGSISTGVASAAQRKAECLRIRREEMRRFRNFLGVRVGSCGGAGRVGAPRHETFTGHFGARRQVKRPGTFTGSFYDEGHYTRGKASQGR